MSGNVWEWCLDDWKYDNKEQTVEFFRNNVGYAGKDDNEELGSCYELLVHLFVGLAYEKV